MKMITATAALEAGIVNLNSTFPIATSADIAGYVLSNAGGEACGGTFLNAFAVSCNSVFAPLGPRIGAARFGYLADKLGRRRRFVAPPLPCGTFLQLLEAMDPIAGAAGPTGVAGESLG